MGGALAMLADGLLERFPSDELYGLHNRPGMPVGQFGITPGAATAGGAFFDIAVTGRGAHGARPEAGIDPVIAAATSARRCKRSSPATCRRPRRQSSA